MSARLKDKELAGTTVTLKLKTADFRIRTRAQTLERPTQLAARIFAAGRELLEREIDGTKFRLIGIGAVVADATPTRPISPTCSTTAPPRRSMPSTGCARGSATKRS